MESVLKGFAQPPPPLDGFTPQEFRARRNAVRAAFPNSIVVLRGAHESDFVGAWVPYKQNSNFFYLTGVDTPDCYLVLLPEAAPATAGIRGIEPSVREILFLGARNVKTETWTGARLGPDVDTEKLTGIQKAADVSQFWGSLIGWLKRCHHLGLLAPYGDNALQSLNYQFMQDIYRRAPGTRFDDIAYQLGQMRSIKSPSEIARMCDALEVTTLAHQAAYELIARGDGSNESEVEGAILFTYRALGATFAYPCIVGSGMNGTVLHYESNAANMSTGDLVVVDVGSKVGHYCSDITRTYPVGGKFTDRQRAVYDLVLAALEHVVDSFKVGIDSTWELEERCREFYRRSPLKAIDSDGVEQTLDKFMPHNISHHLGLDTHDVGDRELPYVPGNVVTIEPGIYLPNEGFGVRIEDNFLVTETGMERLVPKIPRRSDELEALASLRLIDFESASKQQGEELE